MSGGTAAAAAGALLLRSRRRTSMAKSGQCSSQMRHWLQSCGRATTGSPSLSRSNTRSGQSSTQMPQALQREVQPDRPVHQSVSTMGRSMPDSFAFSMASGYPASAWRMTPMPGSVVSTRRRRSPSVGAVGDDDHAGVQAVADAHAAAVVEAHPARARRRC